MVWTSFILHITAVRAAHPLLTSISSSRRLDLSVGVTQGMFRHPREDVVDKILLDGPLRPTTECGLIDPLVELLQTEDGKEGTSSTGKTSFSGKTVGNIKLVTDGETNVEKAADDHASRCRRTRPQLSRTAPDATQRPQDRRSVRAGRALGAVASSLDLVNQARDRR